MFKGSLFHEEKVCFRYGTEGGEVSHKLSAICHWLGIRVNELCLDESVTELNRTFSGLTAS